MNTTVKSLLFVAETSATELRELTDKLDTVPPRQAETVLRAIQKCGDVLSSALDRLSHYGESIEEAAVDDKAVEADRGLLFAALRLRDVSTRGFCPKCGGIARAQ
jgi:hypothetical protein